MIALTDRGLWTVADGMGGHEAGDVASAKAVEALGQLHFDTGLDALVEQAVGALQGVNRQLIALAAAGGRRTIGTTVVGVAISGDQFRCFWAGDSRAYRVRDGAIEQISRDHSVVQDLVEAGMLDAQGARDHPNSNLITRAVGVSEDLKIDVVSGDVQSGDLFLLGSDGLTRLVEDQELAAVLSSNPLEDAADQLIDMVLARGAPDNVTLIIVRCT